jgi:hypothetical protein
VVWADEIETPKTSLKLEVQDYILGPRARQRLLAAKTGRDPAFRDWLARTLGGTVAGAFAQEAKERERAVNRLLDVLARDESATGFAILDGKGSLLGVEIFRDHALMMGFAAQLLRGYVLEAGTDAIRVEPSAGTEGLARVKGFLEALPGRAGRVERERLDGDAEPVLRIPKGLCRVNLLAASGEIAGHGLLVDDKPIHLTLFGE